MDNEPTLHEGDMGTKLWRLPNGKLHRVDGPAVETAMGTKHWYLRGKKHRVDGPAIEYAGYRKEWWLNGKLHRVDGPAVDRADGYKEWYLHGNLHRVDGPALERANGENWYLHNAHYTFDDWLNINTFISEEEKLMLKLQYG
jgi:hypothetical protein